MEPLFDEKENKRKQEKIRDNLNLVMRLFASSFDNSILNKVIHLIKANNVDATCLKNTDCRDRIMSACWSILSKEYVISILKNKCPFITKNEKHTDYLISELRIHLTYSYILAGMALISKNPSLEEISGSLQDLRTMLRNYDDGIIIFDPLAVHFMIKSKHKLGVVNNELNGRIMARYQYYLRESRKLNIDEEHIKKLYEGAYIVS